jgi:hypothetical protein
VTVGTAPRAWPLLAWGLATMGLPALAQDLRPEPSAVVECLSPPPELRGAPEYPFEQWKFHEKGRVKVALEFTAPDRRPSVEVLEREGHLDFVDAVGEHVRTLRVPCLTATQTPARLVIEYIFKPDQREVLYTPPSDADDKRRNAQLACLTHVSGEKKPDYPRLALERKQQGRVLLHMRFDAADRPPEFEVYTGLGLPYLKSAIKRWAQGYRLPCQTGGPVSASIHFVFILEETGGYGFKDITFLQYLRGVKGLKQTTLDVDTNTMGCPFDLSLQYLMPGLPNRVGEIGSRDPARRRLIAWLARSELDVSDEALNSIYADEVRFTVPCVKIDLKPKEKT